MNEFDDLTDLDDVFGPLRSSARSAEMSGERAMVDLMVNAHRTPEEKRMFTSRRARIATLVAAGVLGFGGMAAASPSFGGDTPPVVQQDAPADTDEDEKDKADTNEPDTDEADTDEAEIGEEEQPEVEEQPIEAVQVAQAEIVEPDAEVVSVEDPESDDDRETVFNEDNCEDGNHGKTVSAVARGDVDFLEQYKLDNEGAIPMVTDAAHSSCGKDREDIDDDESEIDEFEQDEESETESDESNESEDQAERPGRSDKGAERASNGNRNTDSSNGNGKSNGNGNGSGNNGNGKRGG